MSATNEFNIAGQNCGPNWFKVRVVYMHGNSDLPSAPALSFALRTLYRPAECPERWEGAILSVAMLMGLPLLYQRCLKEMTATISSSTVCDFHRVACKHKQTTLQSACERWLEVFLVTELSCQMGLRDLPYDLLLKTLRCPRVFAVSEYDLLKTVLKWIYLQLHTAEQTLPSHSTVSSFFCSAPGVFLEQPLGSMYVPLFQALHLHGITERECLSHVPRIGALCSSKWSQDAAYRTLPTGRCPQDAAHRTLPAGRCPQDADVPDSFGHHVEEMQKIHIFPHSWLLLTFSSHYYSIHNGGDMHVTDFSKHSIRFGMIVDGVQYTLIYSYKVIQELPQHTRAVGLYGFYFLLKASRVGRIDAFDFSMERLRHWDPALVESCRATQPFSVRSERCVRYQVRVQSRVRGEWQESCSAVISQVFSLSKRCCRSK
ncbi:hypothetical protein NFI96_004142, partial [Prochilodus magdalenae]